MEKKNKLWKIFIKKEIVSEYDTKVFNLNKDDKPIYRHGVSKKQVESRLRKQYNLRNHDLDDGRKTVRYIFEMEDVTPVDTETMTIWELAEEQ